MRENVIERALRDAIKKQGGWCLKFVSPGMAGVPDRICLLPGGVIAFVELKAPGRHIKAGSLQGFWGKELDRMDFHWCEITTTEDAKALARYLGNLSRLRTGKEADKRE